MKLKPIIFLSLAALATHARAQTLSDLAWHAVEGQVVVTASGVAPAIPPGAILHNGNGKTELTAGMISSGADAAHPNVYQNYVVHLASLQLTNLQHVMVLASDMGGFAGSLDCIYLSNCTDVWVCSNKIHDDPGGGVGDDQATMVACHIDGNVFTNCGEPIHLDFGTNGTCDNNSVSYNQISGATRYCMEFNGITTGGFVVNHNYLTNLGPKCGAISYACGGSDSATSNGHFSVGTEIAYNVILNGATGGGGIEVSGSATNVHDNYSSGGWVNFVYYTNTNLDGKNRPWYVTNNIVVGGNSTIINYEGSQPGNFVPPVATGNQIFAANDPKAPAAPTLAQTLASGTTGTTGTTTTTTGTQQPAPPPFSATPQVDGVHVSGLPVTGGILTSSATGNSGSPLATQPAGWPHTFAIPAGQTTYLDAAAPNGWEVAYSFTGLPGFVVTRANAAQNFATTQPTTVPTTLPSPVLIGHSRDGKTWTVDATIPVP